MSINSDEICPGTSDKTKFFVDSPETAIENPANLPCSLQEVCDVIEIIQKYTADMIVVREDTEDTLALAVNQKRAQLIIFLKDLFAIDIFRTTKASFFYNYLQTLQPFMFIKAVISEDKDSIYGIYQQKLYIFEYPCGTQSIQIKVCLKENQIVLVSFHKGASGLVALENRYLKTAELWDSNKRLFVRTRMLRLYTDHMYSDIPIWGFDKVSGLFTLSSLDLFSAYREVLLSMITSVFENSVYESEEGLYISTTQKISVYSALSMTEYGFNPDSLSEKGKLHALVSLYTLVKQEALAIDIQNILTGSEDAADLLLWLKEHEASSLTEIRLLLEGRDIADEM